MTIPRKHSRPIEVDGRKFRYMIGDVTPAPNQDPNERDIRVTAQEDIESPGRVLQALLPYGFSVTPEHVRKIIQQGLNSGWKPEERGPAYKLEDFVI